MKTIGILARPDHVAAGPAVTALASWLEDRGLVPCLDHATATLGHLTKAPHCLVTTGREVSAEADALVVLGGDGTLLAASRLLDRPIPVLGVNFGSLGFLTEIALEDLYPTLEGVLSGHFVSEERFLLHATVHRSGQHPLEADALNDVVLTKAGVSRMIDVEVTIDGLFVSSFLADGIIVSSPTGSTAYNLAAGGPILQPTLPALVITPICPHILANRPLVVADTSTVDLRVMAAREIEVYATLDGQWSQSLGEGDHVTVTKGSRRLVLVKARGRDFYEALRTKLKWGESTVRRPR
jgi:NAD+ kinase